MTDKTICEKCGYWIDFNGNHCCDDRLRIQAQGEGELLEPECPNCNRVTDADRIEALTKERDQWIAHAKNAIWADSEELKEAEAYAEELEKELNTCRMAQAVMDNTVADLEAKLAKAVEVLNALDATLDRNGWHFASIAREGIRAILAEIKGESHD